jgi:hypothetical protein
MLPLQLLPTGAACKAAATTATAAALMLMLLLLLLVLLPRRDRLDPLEVWKDLRWVWRAVTVGVGSAQTAQLQTQTHHRLNAGQSNAGRSTAGQTPTWHTTRPLTSPSGTGPYSLLSRDMMRLSPCSQTWPGGTFGGG